MIDVQIIPATEEHLQMILPDVRQADIDELYAISLMTTEDAAACWCVLRLWLVGICGTENW